MPGNPKESLLVDAINYGETYQMPPKSKLPDDEIATLTEWVKRGAPWGVETRAGTAGRRHRRRNPTDSRRKNSTQRARYWSFQPIGQSDAPCQACRPP